MGIGKAYRHQKRIPSGKLTWHWKILENEPFEDVFPIENGGFPLLCLNTGVYTIKLVGYIGGSTHWGM